MYQLPIKSGNKILGRFALPDLSFLRLWLRIIPSSGQQRAVYRGPLSEGSVLLNKAGGEAGQCGPGIHIGPSESSPLQLKFFWGVFLKTFKAVQNIFQIWWTIHQQWWKGFKWLNRVWSYYQGKLNWVKFERNENFNLGHYWVSTIVLFWSFFVLTF